MQNKISDIYSYLHGDEAKKNAVVNTWLSFEYLPNLFRRYHISKDVFAKHFGGRMVEYFCKVAMGNTTFDDSAVMQSMVKLFYVKKMELKEIFLICDSLQKTMLLHLLRDHTLQADVINKIFRIFELNFEKIQAQYFDMDYEKQRRMCGVMNQLSANHLVSIFDGTNVCNIELSTDDISLAEDTCLQFESYINSYHIHRLSFSTTTDFAKNIAKMGDRLKSKNAHMLGGSFLSLGSLMGRYAESVNKKIDALVPSLEAMEYDLGIWINGIVRNQNDPILEASMVANAGRIRSVLVHGY